jgi:DNA-binding response OmpR family regulator/anti-sigma regulatory factor (Ser/Thr protein kinase)
MSASNMPVHAPNLLLVEDDRVMRMLLREALQHHGYNVHIAASAEEGLAALIEHSARIDMAVLDRQLPGMSGLDLVAKMKVDPQLAQIPVIMLTGSGDPEEIQQGIDAGVHYYLVKPADGTLLRSIIESALRERRQKKALITELTRHGGALKAMKHCQISVKTLTEAQDTACFLASCFPDPERVVAGLMELLINAVEHGNLGITYEEKHKLLAANTWQEEVDRLCSLPENADKSVDVAYQHKEEGYLVQITDCGRGFDWKRYWHINPSRATASHGRGIARARLTAFDRMAYNDKGNSVTVMTAEVSASKESYAW